MIKWLLRIIATLYVGMLVGVPVGSIVYRALKPGLGEFFNQLGTPSAVHALVLTLEVAGVAVTLNTIFGLSVAILLAGSSEVTFDWGPHSMPRSPAASRMPVDALGEMGMGIPIGLTILMVDFDRRPRFSRSSCNMNAVSNGAAGHLKKLPSTPMMTSPPAKAGRTSRTRAAPSTV